MQSVLTGKLVQQVCVYKENKTDGKTLKLLTTDQIAVNNLLQFMTSLIYTDSKLT